MNIVFVTHVGDCVQQGDEFKPTYQQEWIDADAAMRKLELPPEIPYGIAVGNHDQVPIGSAKGNTQFFNEFFGILRFQNKSWYGGHYGRNNDNHYELFSGVARNSSSFIWSMMRLLTRVSWNGPIRYFKPIGSEEASS